MLPQICIQGIEENLEWAIDFNVAIFKFYPFKPGVWSSSRIKIATGDRSALRVAIGNILGRALLRGINGSYEMQLPIPV